MQPVFIFLKLWKSLLYSLKGLLYITKNELSFQLELIYCAASLVAVYFIPFSLTEKVLIVSTLFLLLVAEVFNSVIEMTVDRISPEKSDFARDSKDLGSAAVFLILIASFIQWAVFLWAHYYY